MKHLPKRRGGRGAHAWPGALTLGWLLAHGLPGLAQAGPVGMPHGWPGQPLAVRTCTPAQALAGTRVAIGGQGFVGVSSVRFNGTEAVEFEVISPTELIAVVPSAASSGPVSVATAAGVASTRALFEVPADALVLSAQQLRGTYAHLVIGGTGVATLSGEVLVLAGARVESGGQLNLAGYVLRGSGFVLSGGATLSLSHPAGLSASGPTGAVQTTFRSFSSDASYVYLPTQPGCETGDGLPARVRGLAVDGPADHRPGFTLTLTSDLIISRALRVASILATRGHALTLLSTPGIGPALLLGPGKVRGRVRVQAAAQAAATAELGPSPNPAD